MKRYRYSIVIPTLNERDNMAPLLAKIENSGLEDFEIVVIDENSPDGTLAAVHAYAGGKPHIRGLANDGLRGLSPSIVKGFSEARGEILCCMDGDMQHDAKDLAGLLKTAENHDFVVGSRYVAGGGFAERWNPARVVISRGATLMAHLLLGVTVRDPMSGFFAVRRTAFEKVKPDLSPRGFKIMLELLYLISRTGEFSVTEYGITFGKRLHGESKLSFKVIREYLAMLWKLRRNKTK
ncbi:MAG: polyprenol monophosphomannose synthase [Victivallaceae bacterium]